MFARKNFQGRPRFVLVGGFLGAGKTTAIGRFAAWLRGRGLRAGVVTNDQGEGLIDTALARQRAEAVAEITGGCFCCRLDELVNAVRRLSEGERPDVFLAEPVGSCTDLMATVILPLREVYRLPVDVARLSVLLDAKRAYETLVGGGRRHGFSKDVSYIYRKQLEEAEILVISKTDLVTPGNLAKLRAVLEAGCGGRTIFEVCARSGEGLEEWFEAALGASAAPRQLMEVDYRRYGEGEALLGWLNATVNVRAKVTSFDGGEVLQKLSENILRQLDVARIEVAHFKMSLEDERVPENLLRVQVTRRGEKPAFAGPLQGPMVRGRLLINLRAEGDPKRLGRNCLQRLG